MPCSARASAAAPARRGGGVPRSPPRSAVAGRARRPAHTRPRGHRRARGGAPPRAPRAPDARPAPRGAALGGGRVRGVTVAARRDKRRHPPGAQVGGCCWPGGPGGARCRGAAPAAPARFMVAAPGWRTAGHRCEEGGEWGGGKGGGGRGALRAPQAAGGGVGVGPRRRQGPGTGAGMPRRCVSAAAVRAGMGRSGVRRRERAGLPLLLKHKSSARPAPGTSRRPPPPRRADRDASHKPHTFQPPAHCAPHAQISRGSFQTAASVGPGRRERVLGIAGVGRKAGQPQRQRQRQRQRRRRPPARRARPARRAPRPPARPGPPPPLESAPPAPLLPAGRRRHGARLGRCRVRRDG
jgi:hypothetical protein